MQLVAAEHARQVDLQNFLKVSGDCAEGVCMR